jgi:hypothetical protein
MASTLMRMITIWTWKMKAAANSKNVVRDLINHEIFKLGTLTKEDSCPKDCKLFIGELTAYRFDGNEYMKKIYENNVEKVV